MTIRCRCVALLAVLLLVVPSLVTAQEIQSGVRIRVSAPQVPLVEQTGVLLLLDSDSLVMEASGWGLGADTTPAQWSMPRALVSRFEVSRGLHARAGTGLLIGVAAGLAVSLLSVGPCDVGASSGPACVLIVAGSVVGGGILGFAGGSFVHTEDWELVPLR